MTPLFTLMVRCFFPVAIFCGLSVPLFAQDASWDGYTDARTPAASDAPAEETEPRFLLVAGNRVLQGVITEDEKYCRVKTSFGSMQIPRTNVRFIGESMQSVYEFRRSTIDGGNCTAVLELADWCFHNGLREDGLAEYRLAIEIAPNENMKSHIKNRLQKLQEGETNKKSPVGGISAAGSQNQEYRWGDEVPRSIVEMYGKKVQTVLVDRCAASQCHGSQGTTDFRLRVPRMAGSTVTSQRNLQEVLLWIDLNDPTASPILDAMVTYHGGRKPLFDVESNQYNNVLRWVQLVAKELPPELAARIRTEKASKDVREPDALVLEQTGPAVPGTFLDSEATHSVLTLPSNPENRATLPKNYRATSLNVPTQPAPATGTADPFDPEEFNARYHGPGKR